MAREGWEGATVVCVASGPSLTAADCAVVAAAHAAGRCKVGVTNSSFPSVPFADLLYAGDFAWWSHYAQEVKRGKWQAFAGEKWTISRQAEAKYGINRVDHFHGPGLSKHTGRIHNGGNGGYALLSLAIDFGATRLILLGYDMQKTGGKTHHHGNHPRPLGNGNAFACWQRRFGVLAKDAAARGIEIVNATRTTALTCFPRASIEDALNGEVRQ